MSLIWFYLVVKMKKHTSYICLHEQIESYSSLLTSVSLGGELGQIHLEETHDQVGNDHILLYLVQRQYVKYLKAYFKNYLKPIWQDMSRALKMFSLDAIISLLIIFLNK